MSSKRFGKSKLLREGYRRSPRLSALEDWKASSSTRLGSIGDNNTCSGKQKMKSSLDYDKGRQASMTRGRKKRRLAFYGQVEAGHKENQTSCNALVVWRKDTGKPASTDQQSSVLSALWLPEKRLLELVLDILQRRDTYEIFAEPVDPNEVPDYYELIEEPMDFGTMRAKQPKLHEGFYKYLQEFEVIDICLQHDVFLATENAMHFNSTATLYFRQARLMHELAKKVFDILKTCPEKLESEFLEARQRAGRMSQVGVGKSGSCVEVATNMHDMKNVTSTKAMQCSLSGSVNTKRGAVKTRSPGIGNGEQKLPYGTKGDGKRRYVGATRHDTYQPCKPFHSEHEYIGLTFSTDPKQLELVNQQNVNYSESLMSFVKDLGPTAKMIARKKILECLQLQQSHFPSASTCHQQAPSTTTALAAAPSHDRHPSFMKNALATFQLPSRGDQSNSQAEFYQNNKREIQQMSYYMKAQNGDRGCTASGLQNSENNSRAMIRNQGKLHNQTDSQSNEFNKLELASLSNKCCTYKLAPAALREYDERKAAQGQSHEGRSLFQVRQMPKQFTFDLPYLRAQLGRISSSGENRYLKNGSSDQQQFSDKINFREIQYLPAMGN